MHICYKYYIHYYKYYTYYINEACVRATDYSGGRSEYKA